MSDTLDGLSPDQAREFNARLDALAAWLWDCRPDYHLVEIQFHAERGGLAVRARSAIATPAAPTAPWATEEATARDADAPLTVADLDAIAVEHRRHCSNPHCFSVSLGPDCHPNAALHVSYRDDLQRLGLGCAVCRVCVFEIQL